MSRGSTVVKVVVGFSAAILLLVFALAYNMGETKQSGRSEEAFLILQKRVERQRQEYKKCRDYTQRLSTGDVAADEHLKMLEARLDFSKQRSTDLMEESTKLRQEINKCEVDKKRDRILHTGTDEINPETAYRKMLWEHRQLRLTREQLMGERNHTREDLIKLIRAYRLDIISKIKEAKKANIDVSRRPKSTQTRPTTKGTVYEKGYFENETVTPAPYVSGAEEEIPTRAPPSGSDATAVESTPSPVDSPPAQPSVADATSTPPPTTQPDVDATSTPAPTTQPDVDATFTPAPTTQPDVDATSTPPPTTQPVADASSSTASAPTTQPAAEGV